MRKLLVWAMAAMALWAGPALSSKNLEIGDLSWVAAVADTTDDGWLWLGTLFDDADKRWETTSLEEDSLRMQDGGKVVTIRIVYNVKAVGGVKERLTRSHLKCGYGDIQETIFSETRTMVSGWKKEIRERQVVTNLRGAPRWFAVYAACNAELPPEHEPDITRPSF